MPYEAIAYPTYQPAMRCIVAISNSYPAVVTTGTISYPAGVTTITSFIHQYVNGMIIRLVIPRYFGSVQADGLYGEITVINTTQFSIDIDTTSFDPFVVPDVRVLPDGSYAPPVRLLSDGVTFALEEYAQAVPFAENTDQLVAAVKNVLPYP